jgi:hypothetical protein
MLHSIFQWPTNAARPELGFCPVMVMGHALCSDFSMLSRTLNINAAVFDTVVKIINTQHLCREVGF